ncbi:MAG TPA: ABC transporter permease [Candidatus Acidoferrales bacterium]|nr:ABC transporter permease [Candidatus Acidoferrales bacterium]
MKFPFGRRREEDLSEEIKSHLDMAARDRTDRGESAAQANAAAHREFGNAAVVREVTHDQWGWAWFQNLLQDVRFGLRMLRKSPGFTAVATLTLALGIGANTVLFSVVNGVLLNPLPYPHPEQVVIAGGWFPGFGSGHGEGPISYPDFLDWTRLNHTFSSLAAYRETSFNLTEQGDAEQVTAMDVSAGFFPLLDVNPILGRSFSSAEDQLGGPPAVILSGGLWKTKFGSSPDIIGKALNLDGTDYTVVGVIPENFYFCCSSVEFRLSDVYVPIGASRDPAVRDRRMTPGIWAVGRMKQDVALAQARADMNGVARIMAAAYPDIDKEAGIVVRPLKQVMVRDIRSFLLVLLAAVGFVLLIACVNVANLLLARATGRWREFAIRAALGASQSRVVRQLLTESVLLAMAGGALGLLVASWGTRAALTALPSALPRANDVRLDPRVLLFTLGISLVAGILFGLAPALRTSHPDLHETLKEGGRGASGARYRTQNIFVVAEMALAVVLLIGAGLTIRTLVDLWSINPGFDPHNVLSFRVGFPPSLANADAKTIRATLRQFADKIASVPGVSAVSLTAGARPLGHESALIFWREGQPKPASESSMPFALWYRVDPDYLTVMKIPLLRGRFLTAQDDANAPGVCVVDEDFARKFFGTEDPIGKRLNFSLVYNQPLQIVGVVGHVKHYGLDETADSPILAQFYMSPMQLPDDQLKTWGVSIAGYVIRTQGSPGAFTGAVRDALREFNSKAVLYEPETMDSVIVRSLASRRFAVILLGVFAALALALASIGIYGVISYVAGQRTHEIGIRIALGAQRSDILKMVLGHGTRLAIIGVVIGLAVAAGLTRLMSKILYGVSSTDPLTFALVAIVLTLVALAACCIPARRAMRVDPIIALRYE